MVAVYVSAHKKVFAQNLRRLEAAHIKEADSDAACTKPSVLGSLGVKRAATFDPLIRHYITLGSEH